MKQWHYNYAGLHVDSSVEIPEWSGFEGMVPSEEADVRIRLANGSQGWDEPAADAPIILADEVCFCIPGVASYRVREGCEIRVARARSASWRKVRLYLLGSAWGALCYQRGLLVVHASAVRVGDCAVAFCARPGGGKSTLAAWLTTKGYDLISDDLTRIEVPPQGSVLIYPSARRLKLWQDTLDALVWSSPGLEKDHHRYNKFHLSVDGNGARYPLPLRAIYVLDWGDSGLRRLTGHAAVRQVVSTATYRGGLLEPMDRLGLYWRQCLDLVRRVPVWELRRPRDLSAMEQTLRQLVAHWAENEQEDA